MKYTFSDLQKKLSLSGNRRMTLTAHGKFYGLRSKYDGRGNLRSPIK